MQPSLTVATALTTTELAAWTGLLRTHQRLTRELDAELEREHGLSLADYDVLVTLAGAPQRRLRMAELADAVLLTRSGLTRMVDRLERRGLVERRRCPDDARGLEATLTPAGAARLAAARPTHLDGVRRRFLDRLAAADVERLGGLFGLLEH